MSRQFTEEEARVDHKHMKTGNDVHSLVHLVILLCQYGPSLARRTEKFASSFCWTASFVERSCYQKWLSWKLFFGERQPHPPLSCSYAQGVDPGRRTYIQSFAEILGPHVCWAICQWRCPSVHWEPQPARRGSFAFPASLHPWSFAESARSMGKEGTDVMLRLQHRVLPGRILSIYQKAWLELSRNGTADFSWIHSAEVSRFIQWCAPKCVQSRTDLVTSRGSYYYQSDEENGVAMAERPRQGWGRRGVWAAGPGHTSISSLARLSLGSRSPLSGVSEEFLCGSPAQGSGMWTWPRSVMPLQQCGVHTGYSCKGAVCPPDPFYTGCSLAEVCGAHGGENGGRDSGKLHKYKN